LLEVGDDILLIVSDLRGISDQQLRPHPIHVINSFLILINYIKL